MTSISNGTFRGCENLNSVTIGSKVEYIEENAFQSCKALTSIIFPSRVKVIGAGAFHSCGLSSIYLPDNICSIQRGAFACCDKLSTVTLGSGIVSIGEYAFQECKEIVDVYCFAEKVPTTKSSAFFLAGIEYATLHVPESSIDLYKMSNPWNNFMNIVAITDPMSVSTIDNDGKSGHLNIYSINGIRRDIIHKGINILKYNNGTIKKVITK